jgi:lysozyme
MSDAADLATGRCKVNEGFRGAKYLDSRGCLTIGYGFNVDAGISEYSAAKLLQAQVDEAETDVTEFDWYASLDAVRQSVLIELAFNMGIHRLQGFKLMLAACERQDWTDAGLQLQQSAWFGQVGRRGPQLVRLLTYGG